MSRSLYWLSDEAWAAIAPHLPQNQLGARRVDDRRVISGIIHVLKSGCRWRDCPAEYGPYTTIYNRYNRWSRRRVWSRILSALVEPNGSPKPAPWTAPTSRRIARPQAVRGAKAQAIGVSRGGRTTKIHVLAYVIGRPASIEITPSNTSDVRAAEALVARAGRLKRLVADRGYDADWLRRMLRQSGTKPVIPGRRSRKRPIRYDPQRYRDRWRIEAAFCRLKDFRRVATRYDKLAANYLAAVTLAAIVAFWT